MSHDFDIKSKEAEAMIEKYKKDMAEKYHQKRKDDQAKAAVAASGESGLLAVCSFPSGDEHCLPPPSGVRRERKHKDKVRC